MHVVFLKKMNKMGSQSSPPPSPHPGGHYGMPTLNDSQYDITIHSAAALVAAYGLVGLNLAPSSKFYNDIINTLQSMVLK